MPGAVVKTDVPASFVEQVGYAVVVFRNLHRSVGNRSLRLADELGAVGANV